MASSTETLLPLLSKDIEKHPSSSDAIDLETQVQENYKILFVTAVSFFIFVVAEIIGALISGSLSLLGDAAAMSVDVFTYICNYYAERVKLREGVLTTNTKWVLQVYVPLFSIICLFGVTAYITNEAVQEIRFPQNAGSVNVLFLYGYATLNLIIDIGSAYMFLRKGRSFAHIPHSEEDNNNFERIKSEETVTAPKKVININMLAAFSHLGADSMRTMSVFVAAIVTSASNIDSDLCDAWAAVVVSITIVFAIIPLLYEIIKSAIKLRREGQSGHQVLI